MYALVFVLISLANPLTAPLQFLDGNGTGYLFRTEKDCQADVIKYRYLDIVAQTYPGFRVGALCVHIPGQST